MYIFLNDLHIFLNDLHVNFERNAHLQNGSVIWTICTSIMVAV